jgi:NAD(P)-dependent dehydrogenase (short-subunit alcohol dehydrogenase family)
MEARLRPPSQVALDTFGRLDVVVNNAGFGDIAPFEQLSAERFKAVMDTNFYGVVNVTRAAVPHMRKQRKRLHPSDIIGRRPPGPAWQHALPCSEMGCRRLSRNLLLRNCPRSA